MASDYIEIRLCQMANFVYRLSSKQCEEGHNKSANNLFRFKIKTKARFINTRACNNGNKAYPLAFVLIY